MIPWREFWSYHAPPARDKATGLLCDAPRAWASRFLTEASMVRLGADAASQGQSVVSDFIGRGLIQHELSCPPGAAFLGGWLRGPMRDADRILNQLRTDPLMPDLVPRVIAAGLAGNVAALPSVVPPLLEEGHLDRVALRDACLSALTVDSRVSSQRVIARVLEVLKLRGGEVEGGLDFLLGVVATRHGSVATALLPCALELADTESDLAGIATVIAGRSERSPKKTLLNALRKQPLQDLVGAAGILAALDLLAEGEDDASFLTALMATREALGGHSDPPPAAATAPTGLWHLAPDPGPIRTYPDWAGYQLHPDLASFLHRDSTSYALSLEHAVTTVLMGLRDEPDQAQRISAVAADLRCGGNLALTRFVQVLEPVFLAGGLRLLWPEALAVADDLAAAGRSVAGFPELLRVLTRYAPEVPDGQMLPPHLRALATSPAHTKIQHEARALVAALARTSALTSAPIAAPLVPAASRHTEADEGGLWHARPPAPALARLLAPGYYRLPDLPKWLATYAAYDLGSTKSHYGYLPGRTLMDDVQLISLASQAVQTNGLNAARSIVKAARTAPAKGPVSQALDLWADGTLTAASYAEFITAGKTTEPIALKHVVLMWTSEQLVRLPTHPGTLSAPTDIVGTVDAHEVAARLQHFSGIAEVGPLDLLLTLLRMRPTDAEEKNALLASLDGVSVWSDPSVAFPEQGTSFDVVPVLREWITNGLSTLDWTPYRGLDRQVLDSTATHPEVLARVLPAHPSLPRPADGSRWHAERPWRLVDGQLQTDQLVSLLRNGARERLEDLAQHDGVLDPEAVAAAAVELFQHGDLPLVRWTESLGWLFGHGAMRVFWHSALRVAAAGCETKPKPNGLPFLMTLLTRSIHEVPDPRLPDAIQDFAASPGTTKSHVAARALVAAAGQQ
jgi:hypothetical protein